MMQVLLLKNDSPMYVACFMQYDIVTQGHSPEETLSRLKRCLLVQALWDRVDGRPVLKDFPEIPERYKQAYERAPAWEGVLPKGCDTWEVRISNEVLDQYVPV